MLEGGEAQLRGQEDYVVQEGNCPQTPCSLFPSWCSWWRESEDVEGERANEDGNFGIEVLMRAATQQRICGSPVLLEYWGGRHRERSNGFELGFILCSGDHWWCIRRCGEGLRRWEEVDSAADSSGGRRRMWSCDTELRTHLSRCQDTVLVLYPEHTEGFELLGAHMVSDSGSEGDLCRTMGSSNCWRCMWFS